MSIERMAAEGHVWGKRERGRDTYLHDAVELFWIETTRERGENGAAARATTVTERCVCI